MPDAVGLEQYEPTSALASCVALPPASLQSSLRGIAKRASACKDHRFQDLYPNLDANLLLICWDPGEPSPARAAVRQRTEPRAGGALQLLRVTEQRKVAEQLLWLGD